jgi:nucleotide-binding universal stress UspA family protein
MYKRILVSTDGSDLSTKAVSSAIDLAALSGAELVALTVIVPTGVSYWDGTTRHAMEDSSRTEESHEESGRAIVHAVKEAAQAKGVKAQAVTLKSELIAESVISAAQKYDCDLIVMASHGRRGVNRILLGSETLNVLTHSKIPVLVLR